MPTKRLVQKYHHYVGMRHEVESERPTPTHWRYLSTRRLACDAMLQGSWISGGLEVPTNK